MFDYIIEFKYKNEGSLINLNKVEASRWSTYYINENCNFYISPPKSKGEVYFFKNLIIFGKLFEKKEGKSYQVNSNSQLDITLEKLIKNYWGSYIAIFFDKDEVKVFRDPSASKECLWYKDDERRLIFSDINSLYDKTKKRFEVNHEYIASTLYLSRVNNNRTALKNVLNLKPGCCLTISDGKVECFWSPVQFVENRNKDLDIKILEKKLKDTVIDCIRTWGDVYESVLLNLSGRLDSSIVAICLKLFNNTSLNALNISFESVVGDELKYAQELCEKYNISLHVFKLIDPKINLKRSLSVFPYQHRPLKYGLGFECLEEEELLLKDKKVEAIFSGCGGDVLFQNMNSIFITQDYYRDHGLKGLFNISRRIAELTDRTVWDIFTKSITNKYFQGRKYLYEGSVNKELINSKYSLIINNDYVSHPWHHSISNVSNGKKFQIAGLVDTENFYTYRKTSEYVDIVHPLLSQPIIELCLSIPSYILTPNLINRGLLRNAFKSYLPNSTYLRRSKGKIGNFYDELIKYNYEDICSTLNEGNLINSEILSKEWLDQNMKKGMADQNIRMQLFQLMTTETWLEKLMQEDLYEKNS
ncbi:Asparagine synthase [compost metagenome]